MTALGIFTSIYIVCFVAFVTAWTASICKSKIARNFAQVQIVKKVGAGSVLQSPPVVGEFQAVLNHEKEQARRLVASRHDYLYDLISAYIVRSRLDSIKRAVDESLRDEFSQLIISELNEPKFREYISAQVRKNVASWLVARPLNISPHLILWVESAASSLIIDKYLKNLNELRKITSMR